MIIVTGGAGFIGANLVKGLNTAGRHDILVVDNLEQTEKVKNIACLDIADFMDKRDFLDQLSDRGSFPKIDAIFHQGACSDTMVSDGRYVMANNFDYSKRLLEYCGRESVPLIYASSAAVYGTNQRFAENDGNEAPLNAYAYSKHLFDIYVRQRWDRMTCQVVGLRYFNVYGPMEAHKGRMASMAFHFFNQFQSTRQVRLFRGTDGVADGEQRRDFVSVADVVAANLHFLKHPESSGIFNIGTGVSRSFNDLAMSVINACLQAKGQTPLGLDGAKRRGYIHYFDMPVALEGKYQNFTEADLSHLRAGGFDHHFKTLEEGVADYVNDLSSTHDAA